jgi:uncharacterized protein (DUF433 family)
MVGNVGMYISRDRSIKNGNPCVTGTAIEVDEVVELIQRGFTRQDVLWAYPILTAESLEACLQYAFADRANRPQLYCA